MAEGKKLQVAAPALPVTDDELVRRAQAGKDEAFEELVRRYERKVYNICYRMLGNEQDASEAMQDAFLRAYRFLPRFQFKSSFFTWLYRIATNVSLTRLRRRRQPESVSLDEPVGEDGDLALELPDHRHTPEEAHRQRVLAEKLQEALRSLPEEHRRVVELRDFEGLSNEEVSRALKLSIAAVKSRLHRGRLTMREKLAAYL
ncbi:MAG: sigma-70 family RNA polymerase sigma factor [candidate division WOR-3 bacterium]